MTITQAQIKSAVTTSHDLEILTNQLSIFVNTINDMAQNNWTYTQSIGGQTVTFTVDTTMQAALVATYSSMKTAISTQFSQLP